MSETQPAPQPNTPEARTETGAIKDQAAPVTAETKPTEIPAASPIPSDTKPEEKAPEGEKSLLNKEEKPKTEAKPGAPEKYEDFKAPEGYEIDKEALAEALPVFQKHGLSQEAAQEFVDFYAKLSRQVNEAPYKLWQETQQKWVEEIKAAPDIGGKLDQVKTTVSRAIDGLGDPKLATAFREAMDYTGAGNNPAFIRVFYKLAEKLVEGGNVLGNAPSPLGQTRPEAGPKSAAQALYPNLPQ